MVKPNYRSKDATELLRNAEHIFAKLTQNATIFTNPTPNLDVLESSLTIYRDAYAEANHRDKRAVILKEQKGKDLQEIIYRLSHYVDAIAKGDAAVILAAGFTPSKSTVGRVGRVPKVSGLRVENVQVGTARMRVRVNPWQKTRLYRYEYRQSGTEDWTSVLHSHATLELHDLVALQQYEFRVSYIGTDTTPNFSDIVVALVA